MEDTGKRKNDMQRYENCFNILQQYTEILYDTKIYETGSIPYKKSKLIKYCNLTSSLEVS